MLGGPEVRPAGPRRRTCLRLGTARGITACTCAAPRCPAVDPAFERRSPRSREPASACHAGTARARARLRASLAGRPLSGAVPARREGRRFVRWEHIGSAISSMGSQGSVAVVGQTLEAAPSQQTSIKGSGCAAASISGDRWAMPAGAPRAERTHHTTARGAAQRHAVQCVLCRTAARDPACYTCASRHCG